MARSARNPHTASNPERVVDEGDTTVGTAYDFPRYSRAHMQSLFMQVAEAQSRAERERVGLPLQAMVVGTDLDETRRRAAMLRLSNAIEGVSAKLTSAEYLELYNAAMGVHQS